MEKAEKYASEQMGGLEEFEKGIRDTMEMARREIANAFVAGYNEHKSEIEAAKAPK